MGSLGVFGVRSRVTTRRQPLCRADLDPVEVFLAWLYFSLILGRCLLVSVAANETRGRLAESRRQLPTAEQVQRLASRDELTHALNRRA